MKGLCPRPTVEPRSPYSKVQPLLLTEPTQPWAQSFTDTRGLCLPRAHLPPPRPPYTLDSCKPKFPKKCQKRDTLEKERLHSGATICKEEKHSLLQKLKMHSMEAKRGLLFIEKSRHADSDSVRYQYSCSNYLARHIDADICIFYEDKPCPFGNKNIL